MEKKILLTKFKIKFKLNKGKTYEKYNLLLNIKMAKKSIHHFIYQKINYIKILNNNYLSSNFRNNL